MIARITYWLQTRIKRFVRPEREASKFRGSWSDNYSNESLKFLATSIVRLRTSAPCTCSRARAGAQRPFGLHIKCVYSRAIVFNCELSKVSKTLLFVGLDARKSYLSPSIIGTCHLQRFETQQDFESFRDYRREKVNGGIWYEDNFLISFLNNQKLPTFSTRVRTSGIGRSWENEKVIPGNR